MMPMETSPPNKKPRLAVAFGVGAASTVAATVAGSVMPLSASWVAVLVGALASAGWGLAVWRLGRSRPGSGPQEHWQAQGAPVMRELEAAISDCAAGFGQELAAMRSEMDRVQTLLSDAIGKLTASFHGMHEQTAAQQRIALGIMSESSSSEGMTDQFSDFVSSTSDVMQRIVDSVIGNSKLGMELVELTDSIARRTEEVQGILSEIGAISKQTNLLASTRRARRRAPERRGVALPWWPTKCGIFPAVRPSSVPRSTT